MINRNDVVNLSSNGVVKYELYVKWLVKLVWFAHLIENNRMVNQNKVIDDVWCYGIEKEGVEDIMEKVDLSIVFEYQHVFEHVGKLHEFKRLYMERREVCY